MSAPNATEQSLRRVFCEGFAARDIAEPLASFDSSADIQLVHDFMVNRPLRIVGVRENGLITGYVAQDELDDRPLCEQAARLSQASTVTTTASFQEVVFSLNQHRFVLVSTLGQPVGVIVRNDLEKAPMRMWLFGMVTLIEMRITRVVSEFYKDESWIDFISESRLAKARQLRQERSRRSQNVALIDCLQLGDKGQLLSRSQELRERYWDRSRRQIEKVVKNLERLRNNLAHSQDIISENWDAIVRLSEMMDKILEVPQHFRDKNSLTPYDENIQYDRHTS